jgi:hypothetical protein
MAFPVLPALGIVALVGLALSSTQGQEGGSSGGGGGGGAPGPGAGGGGSGGGGTDLMTCAQAFEALPDMAAPGGGPSIKSLVLAAMASPGLTQTQYEQLAQALDTGAAAASTAPQLRQAFSVAAKCIRDRAAAVKAGTGGGPLPDAMSCDAAFAGLPEPFKTQIAALKLTSSPAEVEPIAKSLDAMSAISPEPLKTTFAVAAKCLRAGAPGTPGTGGGVMKDEAGNLSRVGGLPPRAGIASNPAFQWIHVVQPGQNASVITQRYFGSAPTARVNELIKNNPTEQGGRNLGPIRSDWAPGTPGQTPGVLNWTSLIAGDRLRVPKSWDAWVDEQGNVRTNATPFPSGG